MAREPTPPSGPRWRGGGVDLAAELRGCDPAKAVWKFAGIDSMGNEQQPSGRCGDTSSPYTTGSKLHGGATTASGPFPWNWVSW